MGDPRKHRKKTKGPTHPWNKTLIDTEKVLVKDYGLKNKKEVWGAQSDLKKITAQAKKLIRDKKLPQAQKETIQLLKRLNKLGLVIEGTPVEDVLALGIKDLLDKRLQSVVYQNKLAGTVKQARQMIVHGHVLVNGRKVDIPSYTVFASDEISYNPKSQFCDEGHVEIVKMRSKEKGVDVKTSIPESKDVDEKVEKAPAKESLEKMSSKEEIKVEAPKVEEKKIEEKK